MLQDLARLLAIADSQGNTKAAEIIADTLIWLLQNRRKNYEQKTPRR
jgi:hypothetical protein